MKIYAMVAKNSKYTATPMLTCCKAIAEYAARYYEKDGYDTYIAEYNLITQGKNYGKIAMPEKIHKIQ